MVVVVGKAITEDNISSFAAALAARVRPEWLRRKRSSILSEKIENETWKISFKFHNKFPSI